MFEFCQEHNKPFHALIHFRAGSEVWWCASLVESLATSCWESRSSRRSGVDETFSWPLPSGEQFLKVNKLYCLHIPKVRLSVLEEFPVIADFNLAKSHIFSFILPDISIATHIQYILQHVVKISASSEMVEREPLLKLVELSWKSATTQRRSWLQHWYCVRVNTPKRYRQLRVKDLPKVPMWWLECDSNLWPSGHKHKTYHWTTMPRIYMLLKSSVWGIYHCDESHRQIHTWFSSRVPKPFSWWVYGKWLARMPKMSGQNGLEQGCTTCGPDMSPILL